MTDAERERMRTPPAERPVMRQVWRHLAFLHWPVPVDDIARLLPPGLEVDTWEGLAWVGLVPFTIPLSQSAGLPIAPAFHETNLRTYVHRGGRDPGVWFFSLDAASRLAVAGARCAYRLPYFHADMTMAVRDEGGAPVVDYVTRRRAGGAAFRGRYRPTGPAAPAPIGSREFFLVERYLLYAWSGRALRTARVVHAPYAVQAAEVVGLEESLFRAAGLSPPGAAPALVHYAREVDVQIYRPHVGAS